MFAYVASVLIQEKTVRSGGSAWVAILMFFVIVGAILLCVFIMRRMERFEAYVAQRGLKSTYGLPESLRPKQGAFLPDLKIRNCYTGVCESFEIALFVTQIGDGESAITRTMFAVRRELFAPVMDSTLARRVIIDTTSSPDWIIASMKGSVKDLATLEAVLKAMCSEYKDT